MIKSKIAFFSVGVAFFLGFALRIVMSSNTLLVPYVEPIFVLFVAFSIVIVRQCSYDLSFFSPGSFLAISIFIFVLNRPIMRVFGVDEIVQAGVGVDNNSLANAIYVLGIGCLTIVVSYLLSGNVTKRIVKLFSIDLARPALKLPAQVCFVLFIIFSILFLFFSFKKAGDIGGVDYFELLSNPEFHAHLWCFFVAKYFFLFFILFRGVKAVQLPKLFFVLFVSSLGFVLVGLRGYTVVYLFLFLYFYDSVYKIRFLYIATIVFFLLLASTLVLEFRIGYSVTKGFWDMIFFPFFTQGASFEVVFGAVNFKPALLDCLPYTDFFAKGADFGRCVDAARGTGFESGGFASSFFAEAYYFGWVGYIVFCLLLGIFSRILDCASYELKNLIKVGKKIPTGYVFMILYTLANLLYFSRSGVFDLIGKIPLILLVLLMSSFFLNAYFKKNRA